MKAMILAAGLGTRLKPLTDRFPKALLEVGGKPLLAHAIENLVQHGFDEIIVNVHHFASQVISYLNQFPTENFSIQISDESDQLLDTGGAIVHARGFLTSDFLLYNVDIITDIDLKAFFEFHQKESAMATLAVSNRQTSRLLVFNEENRLCGRIVKDSSSSYPDVKPGQYHRAFSGIHAISPLIFNKQYPSGAFSIIQYYLHYCDNEKIIAWDHTGAHWFDVGKPETLNQADDFIRNRHH
ncbi:MAG: nucleotidyltransferase family protein [Bacteroidales bacterium]|nr:nucleotidyltransferase family protein [Bacteroidales bacterium]